MNCNRGGKKSNGLSKHTRHCALASEHAEPDRLPLEQKEGLVDVVRKRIPEEERDRIAANIRAAKREQSRGRCKPVTPDELTREIAA